MSTVNSFNSKAAFSVGGNAYTIYRLAALAQAGVGNVAQLPFSIKVLLESLLRTEDGPFGNGRRRGSAGELGPAPSGGARDQFYAGEGDPPGLYRCAVCS